MEQRVRSRYNIQAAPIRYTDFPISCANRTWSAATQIGSSYIGEREVMSDYVVPSFHKRSAAGEKFFNNMYHEKVSVNATGGGMIATSGANACTGPPIRSQTSYTGSMVSLLTPRAPVNSQGHLLPLPSDALSFSEIERVQSLVSTECLAKVGTGDSELWESVAQYRQTMEMLSNPIAKLQRLTTGLLNSMAREATSRNLVKEISDGYLMMRYGIQPLMKDIKAILSSLEKEGGRKDVSSRAQEQLSAVRNYAGTTTSSGFIANWQCQVNDVVTIRALSLNQGYVSYANNLGFDLKGLMLLPWQLMTYSFVADWFWNLSSYLKATMPALGWTHLGACLTTTRATSTSYTLTSVVSASPSVYTVTSPPQGSTATVIIAKTRSPLLSPSVQVNSDFKFDKLTRVGDAVGLVAARLVKVSNLVGYRPNNSAFHDRKAFALWSGQPDVSGFIRENRRDLRWSGKL